MTKIDYQNNSYDFDNLIKNIIQYTGIEINLDNDFVNPITLQKPIKLSRKERRKKNFKDFIERKKKLSFKETPKEITKEITKEEPQLGENDFSPLYLIHSEIEKKNINNFHQKPKFSIPLYILLGLTNNRRQEIAINEMILEKDCIYGLYCPHKTNPLKCPYNHHEIAHKIVDNAKVIIQGAIIPNLFCLYERPWKIQFNKNEYMRCKNPYCWYNHAKGRAELIQTNGYHKYTF